jgi:hypothetical protein
MRAFSLRRAAGWLLVAVTFSTAAALHHHVSFADMVSGDVEGHGQRVVTSHNPLSSGAPHWHRVVRFEEDNCPACQSQRAARIVPGPSPVPESLHVRLAAAAIVRFAAASPSSIHGSRAPPSLL